MKKTKLKLQKTKPKISKKSRKESTKRLICDKSRNFTTKNGISVQKTSSRKNVACQTTENLYGNAPKMEIDSYTAWNLRTQIRNFGAYYWENDLKLESFEDTKGKFYCSGSAIVNSFIIAKFECTAVNKDKGFDYVCYNILQFLARTPPYKGHFTLDISHPNFSLLNSIC